MVAATAESRMRRCQSSGLGRAVVFAEIKCHHRKRKHRCEQDWVGRGMRNSVWTE